MHNPIEPTPTSKRTNEKSQNTFTTQVNVDDIKSTISENKKHVRLPHLK